jgi:phospholipid/cholesterol/gamma-HCH transport system ATP-binding protein
MIEFRELRKSFGTKEVLRGLNFSIEQGEIVFVLGTSGTGKSVLLKCLVGLLKIDSGEIIFENKDISGYNEEQFLNIRRNCGMVFQQPALLDSLTVFENVAFGLRRLTEMNEIEIAARVRESLKSVQLKNIEQKLPNQISYGMQKRVSLARTIALRPKVLLFDEPTTGLDPISTHVVNLLIFELSRALKTTSVVVSHDMQCAVDIADKIVVLDQGEIVAIGTVDEVKKNRHPLVVDFFKDVRGES